MLFPRTHSTSSENPFIKVKRNQTERQQLKPAVDKREGQKCKYSASRSGPRGEGLLPPWRLGVLTGAELPNHLCPTGHNPRTGNCQPVCICTAVWLCAYRRTCSVCTDHKHSRARRTHATLLTIPAPRERPFEKVTSWQVVLHCPNWQSPPD